MEINTCTYCKYYINDLKCFAFIDGIPKEILLGLNNHSKPLDEQLNNIVFEPKNKVNVQMFHKDRRVKGLYQT